MAITEPSYAERRASSALDKYSLQLSGWLKAETVKPRKQRRNLKQIHEDLKELGYEGSYDRVAAFARQWKAGQSDRVNSASKRTSPPHFLHSKSKIGFTLLTKRAFEQLLSERINDRLKGAMTPEPALSEPAPVLTTETPDEAGIVTTAEEIEGFHIVQAILRDIVSPRRIIMRDAQSYCAILLDDNNRKPVCRLRFNNAQKLAVGLFNSKKEEERHALEHIDDLYKHSEQLRAAVLLHLPADETSKE